MTILVPLVCTFFSWADPAAPSRPPANPLEVVTALESVLADAIARAEPSVVAIAREKSENDETTAIRGRNPAANPIDPRIAAGGFELFGENRVSFDYGSGVVIGDHGEILTAFHVVKGARQLTVRAARHQSFSAEILAADPRSDLAVIAPRDVPGSTPLTLVPLALGDASRLRRGSFLLALGNPFNAAQDGRPSASWGILSNVARRLEPMLDDRQPTRQLRHYPTLLQLDTKLNQGMSGGAVINLKGELVGLTTASANASGYDALAGYAIPLDALGRRIVETLKQGKEVEYGFLGIRIDPTGTNRVADAQPGTPAGEGGVQTDDAIVAVGDSPVTDADSLILGINGLPAGTVVKLKLLRHGALIERTVELAKYPLVPGMIATNRPSSWRGLRVDYTSTIPNSVFSQDILNAMARGGVAVIEVETGSPADKAGLKRGQVISEVEGQRIRNPRDFAKAVTNRNGPVRLGTDLEPVVVK